MDAIVEKKPHDLNGHLDGVKFLLASYVDMHGVSKGKSCRSRTSTA